MSPETPARIEPTKLEDVSPEITDVIAELASAAASLGKGLHPATAANLADLVRIMNTYYSNLIEGHNTRPRDIARALIGDFDENPERRDLQIEAAAHVRVQTDIDTLGAAGNLEEPANSGFIRWLIANSTAMRLMRCCVLKVPGNPLSWPQENGDLFHSMTLRWDSTSRLQVTACRPS
jgi:Fic family protein